MAELDAEMEQLTFEAAKQSYERAMESYEAAMESHRRVKEALAEAEVKLADVQSAANCAVAEKEQALRELADRDAEVARLRVLLDRSGG